SRRRAGQGDEGMDGGARQEPKDEEKRSRRISGHPSDSARGQRGFPRPCERSQWTRTHTAGLGSVRGVAGPGEGIRRGRSGARARPAGLAAGDLPGGGLGRRRTPEALVVALSTVLGVTVIDHWLLVGPRQL